MEDDNKGQKRREEKANGSQAPSDGPRRQSGSPYNWNEGRQHNALTQPPQPPQSSEILPVFPPPLSYLPSHPQQPPPHQQSHQLQQAHQVQARPYQGQPLQYPGPLQYREPGQYQTHNLHEQTRPTIPAVPAHSEQLGSIQSPRFSSLHTEQSQPFQPVQPVTSPSQPLDTTHGPAIRPSSQAHVARLDHTGHPPFSHPDNQPHHVAGRGSHQPNPTPLSGYPGLFQVAIPLGFHYVSYDPVTGELNFVPADQPEDSPATAPSESGSPLPQTLNQQRGITTGGLDPIQNSPGPAVCQGNQKMPIKKRVSTKDLPHPTTTGSAAQPQQPVPDPQASIASLAEAFPTSFSDRFQEGQLAGPSSTVAAPFSSPRPSTSSNPTKEKSKGKTDTSYTAPAVLRQISGNRAGIPIPTSDDEGGAEKSTQCVPAGVVASSAHESPLVARNSDQGASRPMSQGRLEYLQRKYDDEAQKLRAVKGKEAVRESDSPSLVAALAPGPLVAGQLPMRPTARTSSGWEMDASHLANFQRPDPSADLVTLATYAYYVKGVLEEDPLGLGDVQPAASRPPVAPMPSEPTGIAEEMTLPSPGLVDWNDEFSTFGLTANEEDWEKIIAEVMKSDGQEEPTNGSLAEAAIRPSPTGEDERASVEEPSGLPYPALDIEPTGTDLTMWIHQLSLEHPGNPEELTLEELDAELDAYWGDIDQITNQAERIGPLDRVEDIELPDQLTTSPLTPLSVMSTPPLFQEEEDPLPGNQDQIIDCNTSSPSGHRNKRGAEASPEGCSPRPRTRSRITQQHSPENILIASASITRRRSARISGANPPAESQSLRDSSPAMSVTSESRRNSRTNTTFILRYHDVRGDSQEQAEAEEEGDDEVDMI
ncbi:hypothetical protein TWF506_000223 [Arthrobotrys conoides]|uniref:Uncharacterized protein n=1 Tax=Arthrobotrys conoides TaxID=74498 RepID=A0AAN8RWH2_9PEZI